MLRSFLSAADRGETVWLGDVREAFRNLTDDRRIVLRLTAFDGKVRDWEYRLPVWRSKQEAAFIQEYLCACVFNMLSCFGGRELRFFLPSGDSSLEEMTAGLSRVFQVQEKNRSGYGKVISISNRLSRAFGGGAVRFVLDSLDQYRPLPENLQADETDLGSKLKGLVRIAGLGLRCGIDVGGTDIKAAVCCDGVLVAVHELDWNPASYDTADKIILPILRLVCLMSEEASGRVSYPGKLNLDLLETHVPDNTFSGITRKYDSIGLSFPDVVIGNRILGGETPKTHGLRNNPDLDYETEFAHVSKLKERLQSLCVPQGRVRIANDGNVAAFTAAVEMACQGLDLRGGVFAHSLGTDLGTGWLTGQGEIPSLPLEMYDFMLDLGSHPQRLFRAEDVRSVRNENSGLPDARKYLGQSAAFRLAYENDPKLLDEYLVQDGDLLVVQVHPEDKRKVCLEQLMQKTEQGDEKACDVFRRIGQNLGQISREIEWLLHTGIGKRYLYGRFVKHPCCFTLLQEGCREIMPGLELIAADENLAYSAMMRALTGIEGCTVAQFGQAIGSIYYGLTD